jgi:hypothetical protein
MNQNGRDQLGDLGIDRMIVLTGILYKVLLIGLMWLRVETSHSLL